jgi:hypothetical protein
VPWGLYAALGVGSVGYVVSPAALFDAGWPVALGGVLAIGLLRWEQLLPRIPPGDIVVHAAGAGRIAEAVGEAMERVDGVLRQWAVAGVSLLTLALILALALW